MQHQLTDDILTVFLTGRIDTSTAPATDRQIDSICAQAMTEQVVFDAEQLEYISSAGLRVILKYRKLYPALKLVNVSPEIFDVLEMTGFTEMMTVERAYRRISVEGCEQIGQGANSKVYRINPDTIVKVFANSDSLEDIQRERELARKAFIMGVPTAISYDVVRVGDGFGSVFELLNAESFAKLIAKDPEHLTDYATMYVDLLKKIHSVELPHGAMPDMRAIALGWTDFAKDRLPDESYQKLCRLMEAIPVNDHMMHGDYHIKNVMLQNGEALLIDMDTLCLGDPIFEFASIYMAYVGFNETDPSITENFFGISIETAHQLWAQTVRLYFGERSTEWVAQFTDKIRIVAYTRLLRRGVRRNYDATEKGRVTLAHYIAELTELLQRVTDLDIQR